MKKQTNISKKLDPVGLFRRAASMVPAYKKFLVDNNFRSSQIKSVADFYKIPPTNKKNYIRKYPLRERLWNGRLDSEMVFTSSSGSTGNPQYFPRSSRVDETARKVHEKFIKLGTSKGGVLVVDAFSMGIWIGGLITYQSFVSAARFSGLPVSVITPGINKNEILRILSDLAPQFEEVILCGYPPFIKDIVEEAKNRKISFKKFRLRFLFAAEAFSEEFRNYLCRAAGVKDPILDTMNIYGSADIGVMAHETPASIAVRRLAVKNKRLFESLFGQTTKIPTLAQYDPDDIYFETNNGELLLTADNVAPLIRYEIGDNGGVYQQEQIHDIMKGQGLDLRRVLKGKAAGFHSANPFVYIFERKDFSTSLYGLQIYPETIKNAILTNDLAKDLTGRFTMETKYDRRQNQYLEINLELKDQKEKSKRLKQKAIRLITDFLRNKNIEYRELYTHLKKRANPHIVLWPYGHPKYFNFGVKQIWTKKNQ